MYAHRSPADAETVTLDAPHAPHPAALEAFVTLESTIKRAYVVSLDT